MQQNYSQFYYHFNGSHLEIKDITKMKKQFAKITGNSSILKILDKAKVSPRKSVIDKILQFAKVN